MTWLYPTGLVSAMRVLLTGASGFIGRALCAELSAAGHEVSALVRRPGSAPETTMPVSGDLGDGAALRSAVEQARPDCVVHLAAEIASQRDARRVREVNVEGTRRLLDACLAMAGAEPSTGPRIVFAFDRGHRGCPRCAARRADAAAARDPLRSLQAGVRAADRSQWAPLRDRAPVARVWAGRPV